MRVSINGFEVVYASNGSKYDQLCIDHTNMRYIKDVNIVLCDAYSVEDDIGASSILVSLDTFRIIEDALIDRGYVSLL